MDAHAPTAQSSDQLPLDQARGRISHQEQYRSAASEHQWCDRCAAHECRAEIRFNDTIDAISTIALFEQVERTNPLAKRITVICDNARYYRSRAVAEYLENSRISILFPPPYSPTINLIEWFWKFFKRQMLYNRHYKASNGYKHACQRLFRELDSYVSQLCSLLTKNFEIIGKLKNRHPVFSGYTKTSITIPL